MLAHLHQLDGGVSVVHVADVLVDEVEQHRRLCGVEFGGPNPLVLHFEVVPEGRGEDAAGHRLGQHRLLALRSGERLAERQALAFLTLEDARARVLARLGHDRLGTHERRRHHDLVAENEVVDHQMVAVELPSPGLGH